MSHFKSNKQKTGKFEDGRYDQCRNGILTCIYWIELNIL